LNLDLEPYSKGEQRREAFCSDSVGHWVVLFGFDAQVNAAEPELKDGENPKVLMKTTAGDIELELFEDAAPNTVANFITLIEKKY